MWSYIKNVRSSVYFTCAQLGAHNHYDWTKGRADSELFLISTASSYLIFFLLFSLPSIVQQTYVRYVTLYFQREWKIRGKSFSLVFLASLSSSLACTVPVTKGLLCCCRKDTVDDDPYYSSFTCFCRGASEKRLGIWLCTYVHEQRTSFMTMIIVHSLLAERQASKYFVIVGETHVDTHIKTVYKGEGKNYIRSRYGFEQTSIYYTHKHCTTTYKITSPFFSWFSDMIWMGWTRNTYKTNYML